MTIICIGGGEDKQGDMLVLKDVLARAKGAQSRVLVVTSATGYPEEVGNNYKAAFGKLGVACGILHLETAAEANGAAATGQAATADVIFFSGGDQAKLARILNGTAFLAAAQAREEAGGVVAGTSAGAAAMSALMITGGDPEKAHLPGEITTGEGFGFKPAVIFDTHFMNRGRLPRLFNLVAAHPDKIGVGLDEDTAMVFGTGGGIEVIGSGTVTLVKSIGPGKAPKVTVLKSGR